MAVTLGAAAIAAGGAYLAARSANNASKRAGELQAKSTSEALAHEKEQDAYVRSRYEKEDAREEEARAAYRQYLAGQGKSVPGGGVAIPNLIQGNGRTVAGSGAQPTLRDMAPGAAAPAPPPPPALDSPAGAMGAPADVTTMPTLADVGKWNEWDPYLNQNRAQV